MHYLNSSTQLIKASWVEVQMAYNNLIMKKIQNMDRIHGCNGLIKERHLDMLLTNLVNKQHTVGPLLNPVIRQQMESY